MTAPPNPPSASYRDALTPLPAELSGFAAALQDRYTVQRELGRGGMATVYLARDLKHDRLVAWAAAPYYDVFRDGRRFIAVSGIERAARPMLYLDWPARLQRGAR